jgi:hypothetical protein
MRTHQQSRKRYAKALDPFVGDHGQVTLPGWFRVVETS